MFTGIIEQIGTVLELKKPQSGERDDLGVSLTITDVGDLLSDCNLGDSICINGTCLTVTEFTADQFTVGLSPETLRRTNLGRLQTGDSVNLERAMGVATRFGGHFVQGHVDSTGTIISKSPEGNSLWLRIKPTDPILLKNIVPKGYITVDGTSLTVCDVNDDEQWFSLMLVEYTRGRVILPHKPEGSLVNLEVDMLGKYVERIVDYTVNGQKVQDRIQSIVRRSIKDMANLDD
ncbi:Riboflavin synthase alpha chain [Tieghemiomyces parasiticus]|uniref:Riboflavin synthase n=1 Tax=Tieghemiomyces parasiticus TaxID=78921 RepID=A0A9W7ZNJ9_9FUNG|nr:Riboflavin synthase alpha chain [Tieghemiomyces parasiticus]KAJ1918116.1 Riboflavin synthase alpha chain [Tieghemiomyces parasiticus]